MILSYIDHSSTHEKGTPMNQPIVFPEWLPKIGSQVQIIFIERKYKKVIQAIVLSYDIEFETMIQVSHMVKTERNGAEQNMVLCNLTFKEGELTGETCIRGESESVEVIKV